VVPRSIRKGLPVTPYELRLIHALETYVISSFDEPTDTASANHPYWSGVLGLIGEGTGETAGEVLDRLVEAHQTMDRMYRVGD
jgi:hypothetical protein